MIALLAANRADRWAFAVLPSRLPAEFLMGGGFMQVPDDFDLLDEYAFYHPVGQVTLEEGIALITRALEYCVEQNIRKLMADITGLTGFKPPTDVERYYLGERWARAARGRVAFALILAPDRLAGSKFGEVVVRNRGMLAKVFCTQAEAVAWLKHPTNDDCTSLP